MRATWRSTPASLSRHCMMSRKLLVLTTRRWRASSLTSLVRMPRPKLLGEGIEGGLARPGLSRRLDQLVRPEPAVRLGDDIEDDRLFVGGQGDLFEVPVQALAEEHPELFEREDPKQDLL